MFEHRFVLLDQMGASPDLALALVLCLLIRPASRFYSCHNHLIFASFFRVDPLYLDSLVDVITTPADPVLALVQETVLSQCRWPLRFGTTLAWSGFPVTL